MNTLYQAIAEYVNDLTIIDTHEHLPNWEQELEQPVDFFNEYLSSYLRDDLISAGMRNEEMETLSQCKTVRSGQAQLEEKWQILKPYLSRVENTAYYRQLDRTVEGLYGMHFPDSQTPWDSILELNKKFLADRRPGRFQEVLREKCKIETAIQDTFDLECDRRYYRPVHRLDAFIFPETRQQLEQIETDTGIRINGFEDWLKACTQSMETAVENGAVAFKLGLAYARSLKYGHSTKSEAEKDFLDLFEERHLSAWRRGLYEGEAFQNYMMHFVLHFAAEHKLVYQIHTGMQAGCPNFLANSNPELLNDLFIEYPDIKFDIFHIGYPYHKSLAALAKMFPNVYIDMCWAHVISPYASRCALAEFLDTVPVTKINGFGGDSLFLDAVYGHQLMARENISMVLAQCVEEGIYSMGQAKKFAERILYQNPKELFGL